SGKPCWISVLSSAFNGSKPAGGRMNLVTFAPLGSCIVDMSTPSLGRDGERKERFFFQDNPHPRCQEPFQLTGQPTETAQKMTVAEGAPVAGRSPIALDRRNDLIRRLARVGHPRSQGCWPQPSRRFDPPDLALCPEPG